MKLYWGKPANPGELRFHISTLLSKGGTPASEHFNRHEIAGLYGIQIGRFFIGSIKVGEWGFSNIGAKP